MSTGTRLFCLIILIGFGFFLSISEISLASARKLKLQLLVDEGNQKAQKVLEIQEQSGNFITAIQIGINTVAILGGVLGDNILGGYIVEIIKNYFPQYQLQGEIVGKVMSFMLITAFFIEFADLIPRRLALVNPEKIATYIVFPMEMLIKFVKPFIFIFNGVANLFFSFFNIPQKREDTITDDYIFAVVDAGVEAGVLQEKEQSLIENIFELDSRWVSSIMTTRDNIVYLSMTESNEVIKEKIANDPHSKFLVCEEDIDTFLGYVSSKDILPRILNGEISTLNNLKNYYNKNLLVIPNTLTLSEALDRFNEARDDFAIILNEYGFVVGLVTLNDVVNTLMGDIVHQAQDDQIIFRGNGSWIIDGETPVEDVKKVLDDIERLPEEDTYETIAGFMMYMLKSIPKKGAKVDFEDYTFEVVDVDRFKIDQLLVTKKNFKNEE